MKNISNEIKTHRTAIAQAGKTVSLPQTIQAIYNNQVLVWNIFEASRVADFYAVVNVQH